MICRALGRAFLFQYLLSVFIHAAHFKMQNSYVPRAMETEVLKIISDWLRKVALLQDLKKKSSIISNSKMEKMVMNS